MDAEVARLRGEGHWREAELAPDDSLLRADLLNEQALFAGAADARAAAARKLAHFEASLAAALRAEDPVLEGWARFLIGLVESVELRRADGFLPGVAAGLLTLAEVAHEHGRDDEARRLAAEARTTAERCGASAFLERIAAFERELA